MWTEVAIMLGIVAILVWVTWPRKDGDPEDSEPEVIEEDEIE